MTEETCSKAAAESTDYVAVANFVITIPAGEERSTNSDFTLNPTDDDGETIEISSPSQGSPLPPSLS